MFTFPAEHDHKRLSTIERTKVLSEVFHSELGAVKWVKVTSHRICSAKHSPQ